MVDFNSLHQLTKNLNVLYIEDDKNFRDETKDLFENIFKSVDIAFDGEMGLSLYKQYFKNYFSYYDIVITDISMPKMDGIELIKSIYP
ncbi:MAG: response regulator [Campylobacterota bacterium]|nr:response regulator [Campylobacterota bacterium]